MFRFFESIKIQDGKAVNLSDHQNRVDRTFSAFYLNNNLPILEELIQVPKSCADSVFKCKFEYNRKDYKIGFETYRLKSVKSLKLVFCDAISYNYKFTDRSLLNNLLSKKGDCDDILIVKNGFLTDISFANICLYDGKNWHTPAKPLLPGTHRARLIVNKTVIPKDIHVDDLNKYVYIDIINAMRGEDPKHFIDISCVVD